MGKKKKTIKVENFIVKEKNLLQKRKKKKIKKNKKTKLYKKR